MKCSRGTRNNEAINIARFVVSRISFASKSFTDIVEEVYFLLLVGRPEVNSAEGKGVGSTAKK